MKTHKALAILALTHFNMTNDYGLYIEEQSGDLFGANQMKEFRVVLHKWEGDNHSNKPIMIKNDPAHKEAVLKGGKKIYVQWVYKVNNFPTEQEIIEEAYMKFNFTVMKNGLKHIIEHCDKY
jgi:hypothetical protein